MKNLRFIRCALQLQENLNQQKKVPIWTSGSCYLSPNFPYRWSKKFQCKMGLTGLPDSYGSWHLMICTFEVDFSVSQPFLSLHSCLGRALRIVLWGEIRASRTCYWQIVRGHRSAWFLLLSVLSLRCVWHLYNLLCASVWFGSFLLHDMFLNLQVCAFEGQNITFAVDMLLTFILYRDAGPGCD